LNVWVVGSTTDGGGEIQYNGGRGTKFLVLLIYLGCHVQCTCSLESFIDEAKNCNLLSVRFFVLVGCDQRTFFLTQKMKMMDP
jgi:hypothetical protein